MGRHVAYTPRQMVSALAKARQILADLTDAELAALGITNSIYSSHDDSHIPISWNDVQAIQTYNEFVLQQQSIKIPVPEEATEGYNQHYHTSDYDGGLLPAVMGVHDHRDNRHGGFAFAVMAPSTAVPQAAWEQ